MSDLTITIIQPDLKWEDKKANLKDLQQKIDAIDQRTELVILPEMFSTGFSMKVDQLAETMDGDTISWMKQMATTKKIVLTGSVIIKENEKYYNRLIWMLPNGEYGTYDKRHLFAFAGEHDHYTPGNKRLIASLKGWKINLQVCYDLRFPLWARQTKQNKDNKGPEYDILIYVANWPERRNTAWKTLLQARSIENQCFTIGVNRVGNDGNNIYHSGDSSIIDPLGEIIYQTEHKESIFTYTLKREKLIEIRDRFPFWKDADHFLITE